MQIILKDLLNIREISEILSPFYINNPSSVISSKRIFNAGLGLAGYCSNDKLNNLTAFGIDEYAYVCSLTEDRGIKALNDLLGSQPCAAMIFLKDCIPEWFRHKTSFEGKCNILFSDQDWEKTNTIISEILEELLAPVMTRHAVLMDIYGVGVLLTGESGIGKSELALDLISRGHRLVADDVVEIKKIRFDKVRGKAPDVLKGYIQIKGIGIINVNKLFGIVSTRNTKRIEMVIRLIKSDDFVSDQYLGTDESFISYFDVELPYRTIPVARGRDMAKIIEVATRDFMIKRKGIIYSNLNENESRKRDLIQEIHEELKNEG